MDLHVHVAIDNLLTMSIVMLMQYYSHDVVTDWSYALAGFLVSTLFGVSPANPSNFSHYIYPDSLSLSVVRSSRSSV